MPVASRRRIATRAGVQAAGLSSVLALGAWLALGSAGVEIGPSDFAWVAAAAVVAAALVTAFYVEFSVGRRIARLVDALDANTRRSSLERLPDLGNDEIGEIGRAVNDLLANLASLEVRMIEQGQELRHTREELILKRALSLKSAELEQRLRERALLFDIVRASASERELDAVLEEIAGRLGKALHLRECLLFLVDSKNRRLTLRAAYGVEAPGELLERIVLFDEGPLGEVAQSGEALIVDQLEIGQGAPTWDPIPQEGSIAILPVFHHGKITGVMAATRGGAGGFSEVETGLLEAIGDQLGLAIRHTQLFDELRRGSQHDDLTGLGNRRLLRIRLQDELHRAERFAHPVSVLAIDIDHFKALNDRHGHPTGDASLRKLAGLMTRNLRRIDTIARTGGEEFVVLLPRTTLAEAAQVGEKLRSIVELTEFPGGAGQPGGALTISVGAASLQPGESGADLLARADTALYEAKDQGRNRMVTASQSLAPARSATSSRI
ncbi:MAG: diguanylate cyclase [Deltaproteobacteria bacterium]|jgi:diguanylate cyclase (GGDEF)-like protein|nr:diguanylate cyclase [Deltaproteobacteria bacterium]